MSGPVRQRNRRGEGDKLRAEIVAAASRLLAEQPPEALSLRAVAREAGVAAPSVYPHFSDLRALTWAVLEARFAGLTELANRAATRASKPRSKLRAWSLAYCRFGLENPGHYRVLFDWPGERVDVPMTDLPGHGLYQSLLDVLRPCVPAGGDSVDDLAVLVWAGLHGLVSLRISKPSYPWRPVDKLVDACLSRLVPPSH